MRAHVPVVLTGAMRSADAPDADGPANLRDALAVAARPRRPRPRGAGVLRRPGVAAVGHAQGGDRGPERLRRRAGRHGERRRDADAAPRRGRTSASSAPPTRRGSTSSRHTSGVTRWRWTPAWPPAREPSCWKRWVRATPETRWSTGCAATAATGWCRGVHPGPRRAGQRRVRPGHDMAAAGAVMVPRLRPPQARVLVMAALAAGLPVADVIDRWG